MFLSWLWGRRHAALDIILYTRRGCHLCDTARLVLDRARRRYGFRMATVDVDTSPALVERYGNWVPVVTVNGRLRFRGAVNPVLLQRLLDATARR
jgi:glutaredoxin